MCILNKIFYRFGNKKQNALLAVSHNSIESVEIVGYLIKNYNFNKIYLELNNANAYFIIKNTFFHSEFYQILKKNCYENNNFTNNNKDNNLKKIKLIDISIEAEVRILRKLKTKNSNTKLNTDFYDDYIYYRISKYVFYKIWNFGELKIGNFMFDFDNLIKRLDFYQSHILFRELVFLIYIKKELLIDKDENIKKYFGTNFQFFLQEANNNINSNFFYLKSSERESNYNSNKKINNDVLVIIGQYHFDNIIKNELL